MVGTVSRTMAELMTNHLLNLTYFDQLQVRPAAVFALRAGRPLSGRGRRVRGLRQGAGPRPGPRRRVRAGEGGCESGD